MDNKNEELLAPECDQGLIAEVLASAERWTTNFDIKDYDLSKAVRITAYVDDSEIILPDGRKRARRRKGDIRLSKMLRWFAGPHVEEMRGDLQEKVNRWRDERWSEGEITRQLRWEFWYLVLAGLWSRFVAVLEVMMKFKQ